ncbi:LutC/YkgG family protein [Corynebacterium auriscanis]|uniref:LutC/YkgG family protein n=1 Tax=Corynebacterium auriscanis TaxID=99807 RepID=UPI0025B371BC|nr:LUD domain-containing protein [Corynebacterium auriscanis]WJY73849.1 Lactate utilization protein C [Corynebacterium auriscanis]
MAAKQTTAKQDILARINSALGPSATGSRPASEPFRSYRRDGSRQGEELRSLLVDRLEDYDATVTIVDEADLPGVIRDLVTGGRSEQGSLEHESNADVESGPDASRDDVIIAPTAVPDEWFRELEGAGLSVLRDGDGSERTGLAGAAGVTSGAGLAGGAGVTSGAGLAGDAGVTSGAGLAGDAGVTSGAGLAGGAGSVGGAGLTDDAGRLGKARAVTADFLTQEQINAAAAVVTGSAVTIADTGTIVLAGAESGRRITTLLPDHHVVVVAESSIVELVPQAITYLREQGLHTEPMTMVSGPSATVDIELIRVHGVHGPRQLDVVIVADR